MAFIVSSFLVDDFLLHSSDEAAHTYVRKAVLAPDKLTTWA
jgi:hypothetical protein